MGEVSAHLDTIELESIFDDLERSGKNLRGVLELIALDMVDRVEDEFATEGHGRWPKLAESTLAKRRKKGRGAMILQDTTHLVQNIDAAWELDFAEAFTNVEYAKYHTSKAPRKKIPLRDFMDIDLDEVREDAAQMLLEEIIG